jgi:transcriptional regulator with XRE-family HTH domain
MSATRSSLQTFSSLGALLRTCRQAMGLTQAAFSELLDMDERAYRRWESRGSAVSEGGLHRLAEVLQLPLPVLAAANLGLPFRFNAGFWYAGESALDAALFEPERMLRDTGAGLGLARNLASPQFENEVLAFQRRVFCTGKYPAAALLREAAERFPDLNWRLTDRFGHACGHVASYVIRAQDYLALRETGWDERAVTAAHLLQAGDADSAPVVYVHSLFSNTPSVAAANLRQLLQALHARRATGWAGALLAGLTITHDLASACQALGMREVRCYGSDQARYGTPDAPRLFEGRLSDLPLPT